MRVAKIPYLNAEPFHVGWGEAPPFDVVEMVPRELGKAARNGVIDAGLMAVADWFSLDGDFEMIRPAMGIAAAEHVRSVALFSHVRPTRLSGKRIGVTAESSTSKRLLELLARARWELEDVEWVPEEAIEGRPVETVDALLSIGDRALETMADPEHGGWSRVVDLAAEWWDWQELPFVFAVWAVRSALTRSQRERFSGFLSGSLAVGVERIETIAGRHGGRLGDAHTLRAYLEHFAYRLGPAERKGMTRFRELLADHDIQEYDDTRF